MKVEIDSFSGYRIYPSKGKLFVRGDSKVFRFAGSKSASLFLQRKNPRKIAWTVVYRRMHKKGLTEEVAKNHQRGIVGADLAAIAAKRNQTATVREQARLAAIAKAKTEKKEKESKKAKPTTRSAVPSAPKAHKQPIKGGKAPKSRVQNPK
ncbi:60S ribosomal protein L24 [Coprinopsis sp. MPI-PUGE-AT-0042]|nr:60S ribosomal protein L24 [Coprinopsis sp. MPI-PUGE-AT-0042]